MKRDDKSVPVSEDNQVAAAFHDESIVEIRDLLEGNNDSLKKFLFITSWQQFTNSRVALYPRMNFMPELWLDKLWLAVGVIDVLSFLVGRGHFTVILLAWR